MITQKEHLERKREKFTDHKQINDVTIKNNNKLMWQAAREEIPI